MKEKTLQKFIVPKNLRGDNRQVIMALSIMFLILILDFKKSLLKFIRFLKIGLFDHLIQFGHKLEPISSFIQFSIVVIITI